MRLLLDTNLLVLWIVGLARPDSVGTHRRLRSFDIDDFVIVDKLARETKSHVSTPHVLAETSNLLGSGHQQIVSGCAGALNRYIGQLDEVFTPAKTLAEIPEMLELGLTDTAIYHLGQDDVLVASADFHLCSRLSGKGVHVVNPRHFR